MAIGKRRKLRRRELQSVIHLMRQRGWALCDSGEFAKDVLSAIEDSLMNVQDQRERKRLVEREAIRQYCVILYDASRAGGTRRQQKAFEELWNYLYPFALYKVREEESAKEYTQRTLIKVWKKGSQCTDRGRFLGWCKVVLLNEIRMDYRKEKGRPIVNWNEFEEDGREYPIEPMMESDETESLRPLEDDVAEHEAFQRLKEVIGAALSSTAQQAVIEGLFLEGLGMKAIAEKLSTTPSNVYTLKSRALARLRQDKQFRRTLTECLKGQYFLKTDVDSGETDEERPIKDAWKTTSTC